MHHAIKSALASIVAQHGMKNRRWLELNPDHEALLKLYAKKGVEVEHQTSVGLENLGSEDGVYGSVFTLGTLERHPNHIELLEEIHRVLQPYGRLLGAVPVHQKIRSHRIFTADKLKSELRFAGFRGVHVYKVRHEAALPLSVVPYSFELLKVTSPLTLLSPHWLVFSATRTP